MKLELRVSQNISPPDLWHWVIMEGNQEFEFSKKSFKTSREAIIDAVENSILSTEPPYHVAIIARK